MNEQNNPQEHWLLLMQEKNGTLKNVAIRGRPIEFVLRLQGNLDWVLMNQWPIRPDEYERWYNIQQAQAGDARRFSKGLLEKTEGVTG